MAEVIRFGRPRRHRPGPRSRSRASSSPHRQALRSWLPVVAFLSLAVAIFALSEPAGEARLGTEALDDAGATREIAGAAAVVDGDTLSVNGRRVRLFGIDAPERNQTCAIGGRESRCGWRSARELEDKIAGRPVTCLQKSLDHYNRIVAVCSVGGEELNGWMVENGQALAYRLFTDAYVAQEAIASADKRGIWQGAFVTPWDWRRGARI